MKIWGSETRISWTIGWILLRYNGVVKVMPSDIYKYTKLLQY